MSRLMTAQNSLNASPIILKPIRVKTSASVTAATILVDLGDGAELATVANTAGNIVVLGVCYKTVASASANEQTKYDSNISTIYEMPYDATGTKKTLTLADVGTKFQLSANPYTLDLDVTTNGFLEVMGFDNDKAVAFVAIRDRKI